MSDDWLFTQSHSGGHHGNGPLTGPDGQPILAAVGDLGDTLVSGSGGISNTGTGGTPAAPISISGSNLTINVTYDQTSRLPSGFVSAINYVVAYYESFSQLRPRPPSISMSAMARSAARRWKPMRSARARSFLAGYSYSTIKSALANTDPSAAASLPASQPVSGTMWVSTAESKALGLTPAQPATDLDGYAGFSSSLPFTYDPNNRAVAGKYDFIGVVEHEFTEIMGRIDLFNATLSDGTQTIPNTYSLLDMFTTRRTACTPIPARRRIISPSMAATPISSPSTRTPVAISAIGRQRRRRFLPRFFAVGQADIVSQADVTTMNALGYQGTLPDRHPRRSKRLVRRRWCRSGNHYFMNPVSGGSGPELEHQAARRCRGHAWRVDADWRRGDVDAATRSHGKTGAPRTVHGLAHGQQRPFRLEQRDHVGLEQRVRDATRPASIRISMVMGRSATCAGGTTIESLGSTALVEVGQSLFHEPGAGGTGPELSDQAGAPLTVSEYGAWTPFGAEATSTGYEVAWQVTGAPTSTRFGRRTAAAISSRAARAVGLEQRVRDLRDELPSGSQW